MYLAKTQSSTKSANNPQAASEGLCKQQPDNVYANSLPQAKDCFPKYLDSSFEDIPEQDGSLIPIWPSAKPKLKSVLVKNFSLNATILRLKPRLNYTKPIDQVSSGEDINSCDERSVDSSNLLKQDSAKAYPYCLQMRSFGDHSITFSSLPQSSTALDKRNPPLKTETKSKFKKSYNTIQSPRLDEQGSDTSMRKKDTDLTLFRRRDAVGQPKFSPESTTEPILFNNNRTGDRIAFSDWKKRSPGTKDKTLPARPTSILSPKSSLKSDDSKSARSKKKVHFSKNNLVLVYKT